VRCPAWLCQRMSARVDSANAASRSLMPSRAAHNGPRRAAS
jgi:hypothetical protein